MFGNVCRLLLLLAILLVPPRHAAVAQPVVPGSTAFCLYEIPSEDAAKRRWINLGIVQYIEVGAKEVRIYYGGGAFGSGHEARIAVAGSDEAQQLLEKLRRVAAACR